MTQLYCKICNWSWSLCFRGNSTEEVARLGALSSQTTHKTYKAYDSFFHPVCRAIEAIAYFSLEFDPVVRSCFILSFGKTYVVSYMILFVAWISSIPTQTNRIKCPAQIFPMPHWHGWLRPLLPPTGFVFSSHKFNSDTLSSQPLVSCQLGMIETFLAQYVPGFCFDTSAALEI